MKTIEVVAAIIIEDGKVFATQRGYGEWQGWWEFPGDKIEPDESPQTRNPRRTQYRHFRRHPPHHSGVGLPHLPPDNALLHLQAGIRHIQPQRTQRRSMAHKRHSGKRQMASC